MTDHIETLEQLRSFHRDFAFSNIDEASRIIPALDAAIALMRGQSEPVVWQVRLIDVTTGGVVHDWRNINKQTYDLAGGQPHQGTQLRCEYRALCITAAPPKDSADEQ